MRSVKSETGCFRQTSRNLGQYWHAYWSFRRSLELAIPYSTTFRVSRAFVFHPEKCSVDTADETRYIPFFALFSIFALSKPEKSLVNVSEFSIPPLTPSDFSSGRSVIAMINTSTIQEWWKWRIHCSSQIAFLQGILPDFQWFFCDFFHKELSLRFIWYNSFPLVLARFD